MQSINLYGNGLLGYVEKPSGNRYYYVKDHLGSIRQVIHKTADYGNDNVVASKNYQPYGSVIAAYNNATDDRYNFTEKERDKETNFDYFGARYYDSDIGRWTTVDPLADKFPGHSPYNYALNNPLRIIDPNGMDTLYFDNQGQYLADQTQKGIGDHVGYYTNANGNVVQFIFNDQGDANSILKGIPNVDHLYIIRAAIGENKIGQILTAINVYKGLSLDNPIAYALQQSYEFGNMDYVYQIGIRDPSIIEKVTIIDGIAYNNFDLGNYYWGKTMSYFGLTPFEAQLTAQAFEILNRHKLDNPTDQRAIGHGARNGARR
ncbi:hypothetical protein BMS3Abin04_02882 [bacterium BMS3Abin04]|nr:hypothetical protein BMS3Abin04_02882 [bacterium BMS3Abin04]